MDRFYPFKSLSLIVGGFTTVWLMGSGWQVPLPAEAHSEQMNVLMAQRLPSRNPGAGLRGVSCGEATITPLMSTKEPGVYLATLSSPILSWQVPETTVTSAEFYMVDQDWNSVYQQMIEIPKEGGEIKINLPNNLSLETGEVYYWQFALICDASDRTKDNAVQGGLQFTTPGASTRSE